MTFFADYKSKLPATTGSRTPLQILVGAPEVGPAGESMITFTNSLPQTKAY